MKILLIALAIIIVLIIIAVIWFLRKKKSHVKQDFLVVTGVRDVVSISIPVVEAGRYATDDRNNESWAIRETLQRKDKETGRMVQLVCGWDCNPLDISGKTTGDIDKKYISALASRVTAESKLGYERSKQRNTVIMWAGIIGLVLALGIVIPVGVMISHGSIHVPAPTDILNTIGH
jgi:hypothetical protein